MLHEGEVSFGEDMELDYFVSIIELFLSQPTRQGLPFLPDSPAHPRGGGVSRQAAAWYLIASWD